jgi:drug/metabolite transporter (DMT)-like permease
VCAGIICGIVLCLAINLQQFSYSLGTTAGMVGFITSLYVIAVPLINLFLFKIKASLFVWVGVFIAVSGMYFLSFNNGFDISLGHILAFFCALVYAVQILIIGHFSPKHNVMLLACVQFFTVFAISLILSLISETPSLSNILAGGPYILYTGIFSSGVAYIMQMKAQKTTAPAIAAVLFSFEAVVLTITAAIILNQFMTGRQLIGCALIFTAILAAQIPSKIKGG